MCRHARPRCGRAFRPAVRLTARGIDARRRADPRAADFSSSVRNRRCPPSASAIPTARRFRSESPSFSARRSTVADDRRTELPRGVYVVNWRVVSAVDGHATAGAFAFGVLMAQVRSATRVGRADHPAAADPRSPDASVVPDWTDHRARRWRAYRLVRLRRRAMDSISPAPVCCWPPQVWPCRCAAQSARR